MEKKYKVNLPKTSFPMKADLSKREPQILEKWKNLKIYELLQKKNSCGEKFVLHDGPPYANGPIHLGHALNKILKDIIVKYKSIRGYDTPYVPGWDCHGLPIEYQLLKEQGLDKKNVDQLKFRKDAAEYARKYMNIQRDEFIRLGCLGYWDAPYLTMDPEYEGKIIQTFKNLVKNGYIYRRKKPVYWCISCETALAEAEIEYASHLSPSVYVKFPVKEFPFPLSPNHPNLRQDFGGQAITQSPAVLIWTTTPWTLPANLALAFHPKYEYVIVKGIVKSEKSESFILAKELLPKVAEQIGLENCEIIATFPGEKFKGIKCEHPFLNRESVGILADFVSLEEGTGIVHIAPGHGEDDHLIGLENNLPIFSPVNDQGEFTEEISSEMEKLSGIDVFVANDLIIEELDQRDRLVFSGEVVHQYPHCWRCKNPIIFRATEQWFLNVEHNNLRQKMLDTIETVKWIPNYGIERIRGMITVRPDWCLSRQRFWGVPLPILYCEQCNKPLLDIQVIEHIEKLITKYGSDVWFTPVPATPVQASQVQAKTTFIIEELLPRGVKCPQCGGTKFRKENDILDVWFDSGVSHQAVLKTNPQLHWPAEMYLEGSDQHRGWFQTSLIPAVALENSAPYKIVLTHGFVLDGQGRAMHKSLGNVISPQEVIEKYGAEIVRLWVAISDYREDVRISAEILEQLAETYRKIRNTIRYLLGNLHNFSPEKKVEYEKLGAIPICEIDRYILHRLQKLTEEVTDAYENYEFHRVMRAIHNFCVLELSTFYLDVLKDRLYTFAENSVERRAAQTVLYEILLALLPMLAPLLSFTAEEVWGYLQPSAISHQPSTASVFLLDFPKVKKEWISEELEKNWAKILTLRDKVYQKLEQARKDGIIGGSLEAKVVISANKEEEEFLKKYGEQLPMIFIVSQVEITDKTDLTELTVEIKKAEGEKCIRCWNYSTTVGEDKTHPQLCSRCIKNLQSEL
ncbi:MAG TPA: isoleucine--tRNA ligase [Elusimicrobia bacterium]|jgi:isoleucyl-tRNA synthetase|nr:isoleucine--tRNA ligase [Elusimicrobiota bacterium]